MRPRTGSVGRRAERPQTAMCPVSVDRARCECSQPTNPVASNAGSKWKLKIRKAVGGAPSSTGTSRHLELGVSDDLEQSGRDLRAGLFTRRDRGIHGSPRWDRVAPPYRG